jgi:hypothetical protein
MPQKTKVTYDKILSNPDVAREIRVCQAVEVLWGHLTNKHPVPNTGIDLAVETANLLLEWSESVRVPVVFSPEGDPWVDQDET